MSTITTSQVKELREKTGVGMMDCKKALVETKGDVAAAIKYLREKGLATAQKKTTRETKEGRVFTNCSGNKGIILELLCETDFVAKNENFIGIGNKLTEIALAENINSKDKMEKTIIDGKSFQEVIAETVLKIGENIVLGNLDLIESKGTISQYNHMNGKISVLVSFNKDVETEISKDIAMQIAAAHPLYLKPEEVPGDVLDHEKDIIRNHALAEGKPEQIIEKMLEGKIKKYYKEVCLLEQAFIKDTDIIIKKVLPEGTTVDKFVRYQI